MQNQVVKSHGPVEFEATIKKSNFACVYICEIIANMTQVSNVAPGPLVETDWELLIQFD
jgi:hypothetical protein